MALKTLKQSQVQQLWLIVAPAQKEKIISAIFENSVNRLSWLSESGKSFWLWKILRGWAGTGQGQSSSFCVEAERLRQNTLVTREPNNQRKLALGHGSWRGLIVHLLGCSYRGHSLRVDRWTPEKSIWKHNLPPCTWICLQTSVHSEENCSWLQGLAEHPWMKAGVWGGVQACSI